MHIHSYNNNQKIYNNSIVIAKNVTKYGSFTGKILSFIGFSKMISVLNDQKIESIYVNKTDFKRYTAFSKNDLQLKITIFKVSVKFNHI
jgi:hypothetical protein